MAESAVYFIDPFNAYLRMVKRWTDAINVSLFFYSPLEMGYLPKLLHESEPAAVPELKDLQTAERLIQDPKRDIEQPSADDNCLILYRTSRDSNCCLLRVSPRAIAVYLNTRTPNRVTEERRMEDGGTQKEAAGDYVWLGLRFAGAVPVHLMADCNSPSNACRFAGDGRHFSWLGWSLAYGFNMARQVEQLSGLLKDPISRLPGRVEFQAHLKQVLKEAEQKRQPLGLALINPDDFGHINHRLGRENGDLALQELAGKLEDVLRHTDALFHYGGAVFGLVMQSTGLDEANRAAERIRHTLSQQELLNGAVKLSFSIGVVVHVLGDGGEQPVDANEIMRRADRALNAAKLSGGGQTMVWEPGGLASIVDNLDRLSGIFTADTEKDYRNMLLLWDTVTVITSHTDTQTLATDFVARLKSTFKPKRIGLFHKTETDGLTLLAAVGDERKSWSSQDESMDLKLSDKQKELLERVRVSRRTERLRIRAESGGARSAQSSLAYAVPLLASGNYLGCLYIDGPEESFVLDSSDLVFCTALANQVAVALDRASLALRWKQQQQQESRQLREEVRGLRTALQHSRLVYRSPQIQAVMDVLRRVAPTDATVLITGESGTGKEVLARTLHEQSLRHKQPFVTVDCGAIAQSLMDAELFGHVKGAYTGAQESAKGRIAQAEGGTLFLDEIGELPLEVQAKLLRFVQEKEFTPVGSSTLRRVDVRIVAATNRDLAAESAAGTFRRDLYYRLQVVTLTSPPLRERPDDILPLAYFFLEKYAVQNDKGARHLSPDAEAALLRNPWRGNVRELQNRILQAVVMSDAEEIDWSALGLNETDGAEREGGRRPVADSARQPVGMQPAESAKNSPSPQGGAPKSLSEAPANPWGALRQGLQQQVSKALSDKVTVPLGRWLTSDLVLAADTAAAGNARQASGLLGMAETTYRRQLEKAQQESAPGLSVRTSEWMLLQPVFSALIAAEQENPGQQLLESANRALMEEITIQVAGADHLGAALLGVTKPTYQRRKADLPIAP